MPVIEPIMEAQKKVGSMNSPPPFSSIVAQHRPSKSKQQPVTRGQIWLLIRRVMVFAAAIVYIHHSMSSALMSIKLLLGTIDTSIKLDPFNADYITSYAIPTNVHEGGASTVAQGKLVNEILHGDLTPRVNQTLYLHSKTDASFDECPHYATEATQRMYSNVFLRQIFSEAVRDTANGVPEMIGNEMVIPIVDCSFTALRIGDRSVMRAFFLMRKTNSNKLSDSFLFVFSLGIQDYRFPEQFQVGATGLLVLSVVSDFNSPKINRYYSLSPGYPFHEASFDLYTTKGLTEDGFMILENIKTADTYQVSRRVGIFRVAEAQQSIITNLHWDPAPSPELALSLWKRVGVSIRQDAWGWVGGIHFFFVAETCFNLLVLLIVIYRNKKKGKIWIGDAFVSISKATIIRALMVIVAWALNGFWSAHKFMLEDGNIMGNVPLFFVYPSLLHGDVMMIYLGIVSLIGVVLCERIDPALSMLLFEIGFANRQELLRWFPAMADKVITIARHEFANGARAVDAKHMAITPLRMSSTHELSEVDATFSFCALFPIFFTLIFLVAYVPMRRVYRHYYPDRIVRASNVSGAASTGTRTGSHASKASQSELSSVLTWKSTLTIFEVATGAALQSRVGLVSDYDNCVYIKGMKFASADGIYCNGFVVVQDKYLIRTGELWMVLLMVLTRVRFRDLYVYEVDGFTVQKMARLFYPDMLTWSDMLHLHTMILA